MLGNTKPDRQFRNQQRQKRNQENISNQQKNKRSKKDWQKNTVSITEVIQNVYYFSFTMDIRSTSPNNQYLYPSAWVDQRKKQDYMVVKAQVITKLLPSKQIVHSTQQVVYLAHANMHTNVYSGSHYCKQVL